MATDERNTMRSLDRALDILEILEATDVPLRLTELARRSGLHVATVQRIINALKARDRVAIDGAGYTVGAAAAVGIHAFTASSRLVGEARPFMHRLAGEIGLPVSLNVCLGATRLIVERFGGDDSMQHNASIGRRLPLHLGAAKVLLAFMEPAKRDAFVQSLGTFRRADGTAIDVEGFLTELKQIREQGYALASQERIPGRFSIGVPIHTGPGVWNAAVLASGRNLESYRDRLPSAIAALREAAAEISLKRHYD